MRVLVLNPPVKGLGFTRDGRCQSEENTWLSAFPPVMLAGIAGTVRKKYDVKLIDCIGEMIPFRRCIQMAADYRPDFTIVNTSMPTFEGDMDATRKIKELTGTRIIVYGEYVTNAHKEVLRKYRFIDYIIRGEAETPVMSILSGKPRTAGVALGNYDGGIWQEPELDRLAMPAYDLLPPYYYPLKGKRWMFIRSGRGCPYNCLFCVVPRLSGRKLRYHSAGYMTRQIRTINKLGINYFMLWDELATYDRKRMFDLCNAMIKTGLSRTNRWACTTRVDRFDETLARNMKRAGCFIISFGIESASQEVLDINRKGIKVEDSINAVKAARKNGIRTIGHFMIGVPGDNEERILESIRFAKKLKLDFAQFYAVAAYRGSELYEVARKKGWLIRQSYKSINQSAANIAFPGLSAWRIEKLRKKAYLSFYLRPNAAISLMTSINAQTIPRIPQLIKRFLRWVGK